MNCQEALDLLYDIIDKEASEIDTKEVQKHLKQCHHCFEVYRIEGELQEFINEKLKAQKSTPRLDSLKNSIVSRLDEIDAERGVARKKPPFWNASFTLAAAAFVVITIGAAYLLADFYRHNETFVPLERAHWTAGKEAKTYDNSLVTASVLNYLSDTMQYAVDKSVKKYKLIGGHMETLFGVPMAHLLYENPGSDKFVSVFVAPAADFKIPDDLSQTKVSKGDFSFFDHHCRGCRLVYHREGNLVMITATTDHETDLLDFLPGKLVI